MPNSLIFALGITLLYIVVTFNRKVYDELYLKTMKIDILSGIMVSAWFFALFGIYVAQWIGVILSVMVFGLMTFFQYSLYITNKKKNNGNIDGNTSVDIVNSVGNAAPVTYVDNFTGRKGTIKSHVNGKYYLGSINMGTIEKPSIEEILIYNENGFNNGDEFEITHIQGSNIVARKV